MFCFQNFEKIFNYCNFCYYESFRVNQFYHIFIVFTCFTFWSVLGPVISGNMSKNSIKVVFYIYWRHFEWILVHLKGGFGLAHVAFEINNKMNICYGYMNATINFVYLSRLMAFDRGNWCDFIKGTSYFSVEWTWLLRSYYNN